MTNYNIANIENLTTRPIECYNCYDKNLEYNAIQSKGKTKGIVKDVDNAYCRNCETLMLYPKEN